MEKFHRYIICPPSQIGSRIYRLHHCRKVNPFTINPPVYSRKQSIMLQHWILETDRFMTPMLSGNLTSNSILVLIRSERRLYGPDPIHRLVMSGSNTYMIKLSPYPCNCSRGKKETLYSLYLNGARSQWLIEIKIPTS